MQEMKVEFFMKKKPYFSKKGNTEDFDYVKFNVKVTLLLIPILLVIFLLYEFVQWLGFV